MGFIGVAVKWQGFVDDYHLTGVACTLTLQYFFQKIYSIKFQNIIGLIMCVSILG